MRRRLGAVNEEYANTKLLTTRLVYCPFRERKVGWGNVDFDGDLRSHSPMNVSSPIRKTQGER